MSFDKTFMTYAVLLHFVLYWIFVVVNAMALQYSDFKGSKKSIFVLDMMSYTLGIHTGTLPLPRPEENPSNVSKRIYFAHSMLVYLLNIAIVYKLLNPGSVFAELINNKN